jgi:hypothetical protein
MPKLFGKLLLYAAMSLFVACGAHAYELEVSTGLVCDTEVQATRYFTLMASGEPQALQIINTEAKSNVCIFATVAYVKGASKTTVVAENGRYDIVEILVVGFMHENAWRKLPPTIQYVGFFEREDPA